METTKGHVLKLSLKELALRRVVVNLWNDSDVLSAIGKLQLRSMRYNSGNVAFKETFVGKVRSKLSELVAPELLKRMMNNFVVPIGSEIRDWKRYHEPYITDSNGEVALTILKKLCWTSLGSIDYQKTAEELVNNELVDLVNRYILACLNCMEDRIRNIWEELPEKIKNSFYNEEDLSHMNHPYLPYFWPYILKGEESKLNNIIESLLSESELSGFENFSSNRRFFHFAACEGNKAATKFFFNKLNCLEREETLVQTGQEVVLNRIINLFNIPGDQSDMDKHTEVLCYLLSLMTSEQQLKCLKNNPMDFFRCFMDWPWFDMFSEITRLVWTHVTPKDYELLLMFIDNFQFRSFYFNPKMLQEWFIHSPIDFKNYFFHQAFRFDAILHMVFNDHADETIQRIFENIDVDERAKLVFSSKFYKLFDYFLFMDRWHLVEFCLQKATLSKENKEKLKKTYVEFSVQGDKPVTCSQFWEKLFKLLDETDTHVMNKRSSGAVILTEAKKLCSGD